MVFGLHTYFTNKYFIFIYSNDPSRQTKREYSELRLDRNDLANRERQFRIIQLQTGYHVTTFPFQSRMIANQDLLSASNSNSQRKKAADLKGRDLLRRATMKEENKQK